MSYANTSEKTKDKEVTSSGVITYLGLILLFIFEYFNPTKFFPSLKPLHLNTIIPLATLCLLILTGGFKNVHAKQNYLYVALCILVTLSMLHALITIRAFERTTLFLGYLIFYFLIINTVNTIKRVIGVIWVLTIIHALLALLNPDFLSSEERRIGLVAGYFLGNGNDFSLSLIVLFPLTMFLLFKEEKVIFKIFIAGIGIILLILIIMAESRASTLAFSGMMIYMWLRMKNRLLGSLILGLIVLGVVAFASQTYFSRIESIEHYEEDSSARGRLDAWGAGLQMALDHPILGVGAGNFNSMYGRYYKPGDAISPRWISPHSTYVQCMAELGFTGLILFLSIIICNFKFTSSMRKRINNSAKMAQGLTMLPTAIEMSLIGFCINAGFLGAFYYPHHFVISGLTVSLMHIMEKKSADTVKLGRVN